jgi:hypothetical protein
MSIKSRARKRAPIQAVLRYPAKSVSRIRPYARRVGASFLRRFLDEQKAAKVPPLTSGFPSRESGKQNPARSAIAASPPAKAGN